MSQPFSRRSNSISKLSILAAVILVTVSFALGEILVRSSYHTGVGEELEQPIPFSHQHHVHGLGLDCRFCHTTVEHSASAGFPDTQTCMTCHSQIWKSEKILEPVRESARTGKRLMWFKVHRLPDYVYFNHSIHINKGVSCSTCHGDVSKMKTITQVRSFFMKDCMECHTSPERELGSRIVKLHSIHPQRITDCSRCHR